ncbi:anti-sigma regulatory factor (Ser/Thr protein kinase) [Kutzneria viridogrisea]|uniref:Anti-sigma regulatory factor (Ser/Thr protein kinase) n=1 Tax=Kutzneria viridogrisea TaxID=47990 RepID=A0ABR6BBV4_9PSEU|nr:ATP-binding protein [Kutzneria albida]MBA8924355.1 anti-sigma regulatory factor (Ser/Thr protein kinase) [Kutzneria viridogrisea]
MGSQTLRAALLRCVAEEPNGVVIRTDRLHVPSGVALSMFTAIAQEAADWPGVPVVLVADQPLDCGLRCFATVTAAVGSLPARAHGGVATLHLTHSVSAPRAARRFVAETCRRWGLEHMIADVELVVSELAENAVRHAESRARLRMALRADGLAVAVRDDSPAMPAYREPDVGAPGGRGLVMVAGLSKVWGCLPTWVGGKVVWAVLRLAA